MHFELQKLNLQCALWGFKPLWKIRFFFFTITPTFKFYMQIFKPIIGSSTCCTCGRWSLWAWFSWGVPYLLCTGLNILNSLYFLWQTDNFKLKNSGCKMCWNWSPPTYPASNVLTGACLIQVIWYWILYQFHSGPVPVQVLGLIQ